ncbi:MAG: TA system VapC family ribonuclease toxin [Candidatus Methylacidiphilales bacterium]|nr:TA system VapC family ribonuclease toxin [Candidatus Methylacidiphilales bacterium]
MRALLDVNVLVALFDQEHTFNDLAHQWFESNRDQGWATCPLTENGLVRVLSHPRYSSRIVRSPGWVIESLRAFIRAGQHLFWPDDVSLLDSSQVDCSHILSSRQITHVYLLSLAVKHQGRLVTFDEGIRTSSVPGAQPGHLCVLGGGS